MAENIIIHFHTANHVSIGAEVGQLASPAGTSGEVWQYPNDEAFTLTIYPYDEILTEYEPEDVKQLQSALGDLPSASLAIELRRSTGNRAVGDAAVLAEKLLRLLAGVVDDTYSEIWTVEEIESGVSKSDGAFLDCYRSNVQPSGE